MEPLIFLTVRSVVNGVKRALTSAKRLIGLIGVCLYYFLMVLRPQGRTPTGISPIVQMPAMEAIDSVVFWIFAALTLFLMVSVGQRSSFRPADVDVLFPTPVSPKVVLVFRLLRDYLFTLIFPFLIALITYRPLASIGALVRNFPHEGGLVFKAMALSWFLVAICWVSIQYGVSLSINRSDLQSDRNKKVLAWGLGSIGILVAALLVYQIRQIQDFNDFIAFSHFPVHRVVFFSASLSTAVVMGTLQGDFFHAAIGVVGLCAFTVAGLAGAFSQSDYMYDQAAAKGFGASNRLALQRKGDMIGLVAEQAREGKFKVKSRWYTRITALGASALLWKEVVIQIRSTGKMIYLFAPMVVLMTLVPVLMPARDGPAGILLLFMMGMGVFMIGMAGMQSGFIELLQRVDMQKPLPFSPATIVLWEILSKGITSAVVIFLSAVVAVVVNPSLWPYVLAGIIAMPTLGVLMSAALFIVIILFPDVDDPTQRSFRGLMTLLGMAILCLPGVGLFAVLLIFLNPALAAIAWAVVNLGITMVAAALGGNLYAQFNPSE